jgi:RNA polymerase sigma factor (sigma-70 family)
MYLYPIALYKTHDADLAQDVAQRALIKTWRSLSQCREPGSFFNYAMQILLNEIRDHHRQEGKQRHPAGESIVTASDMNHPDSEEDESKFERLGDDSTDSGLRQAMDEESQRELLAIIRRCLKSHPQQTIIIESFFDDKGYKEIAEKLGITVNNVHVLRHRALAALRKREEFIRFFEDRLS